MQPLISQDLQLLLDMLPLWIQEETINRLPEGAEELVLQANRPLMIRCSAGYARTERIIDKKDMDWIRGRLAPFRSDNRTGISGTLHRISATKDRYGDIIGLHIRMGKSVVGVAEPLTPSCRT